MDQLVTIQRLTNDLKRIEAEISDIRRVLKALPEQQAQQSVNILAGPYPLVNKEALKKHMRDLFLALSIQGESVGAENLQKQMRETYLTTNELSQSIIAAREE